MTSTNPPTALFTSQNMVTIGAAPRPAPPRPQHEVAIIGFDDVMLADLIEPGSP